MVILFTLVVLVSVGQPQHILNDGYVNLENVTEQNIDEWIYVPEYDLFMKQYPVTGVGIHDATINFLSIVSDHVENLSDYDKKITILPSYLELTDLIDNPNSIANATIIGSVKIELGKITGDWAYLLFIDDEQVNIAVIKSNRTNW